MTVLAANIHAEMARAGLRRKHMAKAIGKSPSAWDKKMVDPESRLSVGELKIIAARLGVEISKLV